MDKTILFKSDEKEAWFWADKSNVADSLRVIFEDERIDGKGLTGSWLDMDPDAKDIRMQAIDEALHNITIDKVTFTNHEARPASDDISNLYELFMLLHEHPEARLTHVSSNYVTGITELDSDGYITVENLLKTYAHFIAEDILDIEAELYLHANETSPVEDFKAFMKSQNDKHKDQVDAIIDAHNYVNDIMFNRELDEAKTASDNDPINHPKHYQASNGLEAIDCIEAFVEDLPGDIGYLIGNAMKYLCRFDKKGKPVEDLQKARWYIERAIKSIESRKM